MTPRETIQSLYEAFGRADVSYMVELFGDDARLEPWEGNTAVESGRIPYLKRRVGRSGAADFFASLACAEVKSFAVTGYLEGQNEVCVKVSIELLIKATGKSLRDDELHLWTVDAAGRITSLRHYVDTAKHIDANTP